MTEEKTLPEKIVKRNGAIVAFDLSRVERAVNKCYASFGTDQPSTPADLIVKAVANVVSARYNAENLPNVEDVQDTVEAMLMASGEYEAARSYILYRSEHAKQRIIIPDDVREAFELDATFFPTALQRFMFYDKYSRFNWELGRRETWPETVGRVVDYLAKLSNGALGYKIYNLIQYGILNMNVMPSMRCLAMAGPAAERNSMAIYNCSYLPVKDFEAFSEAMLISLAGCGVGYSVEREYVEQFPRIKRQTGHSQGEFFIEDTSEGWAAAVHFGIKTWFDGGDVRFNYNQLRKEGTPLKTKGGRASGPRPLQEVLDFCRDLILDRQGRFLRPIDAHDLMCKVGGAAVSGGVRRTAMISLFDYDDVEMRSCKDGIDLDRNPQRWNANNSAVWPEDIEQIELIKQFTQMFENHRGEPGIFSRTNANLTSPERRLPAAMGSNPCGEINLRPYQFCNLTIPVLRPHDTVRDIHNKVEIATIIGTIQSLATTFPGMRPEWKRNCEEERLLGVDLTGQRDCLVLQHDTGRIFSALRETAIVTNREHASKLGINQSAAITCVKPNGNSSQLLDTSSGQGPRWAPFYVRNIRVSPYTPIYRVLKTAGVPMDPENGQTEENATSWVIHFPVKAPEGAITRRDLTAIDQCEWWLTNKLHWTEHNPSVTITYEPEELIDLMRWVYTHQHMIGGMAFLPTDDAKYAQMPYEEIDEATYERLTGEFPEIDFSLLFAYEKTDMTIAAQEVACSTGECEL